MTCSRLDRKKKPFFLFFLRTKTQLSGIMYSKTGIPMAGIHVVPVARLYRCIIITRAIRFARTNVRSVDGVFFLNFFLNHYYDSPWRRKRHNAYLPESKCRYSNYYTGWFIFFPLETLNFLDKLYLFFIAHCLSVQSSKTVTFYIPIRCIK